MPECPETIEGLKEIENMLPLCRITLYKQAKAKIETGAAKSISEAARQLGDETGRNTETIRQRIIEGEKKVYKDVHLSELAETNKFKPEPFVKETEQIILRQAKEITKQEKAVKQQNRIDLQIKRDKQFKSVPLPDKKYSVIYLDPPWRYEYSISHSRDIENQYPTMSLDEIKALKIPADENCIIFMWATSPKLFEAFEVLQTWGFTYKTCAVWVKDKIGMGYYFRQQHELLLIAAQGTPIVPAASARRSSILEFPRMEHSAKPKEVYNIIDDMYPGIRKLEMFSREKGGELWEQWGNEVE